MEPTRVVDAHVHFWDPAELRYSWLDDLPALLRPFLPADYEPLSSGTVDAVLFVEANCSLAESAAEVAMVERMAADEPRIAGTVAFVNLLDEAARPATLARLAGMNGVVGVRQNIQGHAAGYAVDNAFVRGVEQVGLHGLTFDLCVTAHQLAEVTELVRRCADTRFVLDHCGKPAIRDGAFEPWASDIRALAAHANVSCKLSGLLTEARADQLCDEALLPYARQVLDCFGPSRLIYGSDWPVVTLAGGAGAWRAFTDRFTAAWTLAERQLFYSENAIRLYGLPLHVHS